MTSPPETDREYAYFSAIGSGDTSGISELLDLSPWEQWNVGDEYERREKLFIRRSSAWQLNSGLDDTRPIEEHLHSLLGRLQPRKLQLLQLATQFKLQFVCVSYAYQSCSFEIPMEVQRSATELGINFWFDGYCFGDIHEEITELRSELNAK